MSKEHDHDNCNCEHHEHPENNEENLGHACHSTKFIDDLLKNLSLDEDSKKL